MIEVIIARNLELIFYKLIQKHIKPLMNIVIAINCYFKNLFTKKTDVS